MSLPPSVPSVYGPDDVEFGRLAEAGRQGLTPPEANDVVGDSPTAAGRRLWESMRGGDDRHLYWRRLAGLRVRVADPASAAAFDAAARGFVQPSTVEAESIIVVTGFDPFHLDRRLDQCNPAGRAALALDDSLLERNRVVAGIFPVRFDAFDAGIVEGSLGPWLADDRVRAIVTVSMGRDGFDLERFPGRRRSSDALDNANRPGGGSASGPHPAIDGPEFVEFSLPVERAIHVSGRYRVTDNRRVRTLQDGWIEARSLDQLADKVAVDGSGGGFLSNEIAYRVARLRDAHAPGLPVGHVHTPRVLGAPASLHGIVDQTVTVIGAIAASL